MHVSPDSACVARVRRARSQLVTAQPFFGALALSLELQERPDVPTMCTDGARLAFNPAFIESLSEAELLGVVVHEVLHLAYLHPVRRGRREMPRWNAACDYAINPDVIAAGFKLPKGVLLNPAYAGMSAEAIYSELEAAESKSGNKPGKAPDGQGQPSPGNGPAGQGEPGKVPPDTMEGAADPGQCGGVVDAAPDGASMAEAAGKMESTLRQAAGVAIAGAGEMPGGVARIIGELNRPRIDWRAMLARFIDEAATRVTDWSRPDKRHLDSGFFMPSRKADSVGLVALAIDTSGSMSRAALEAIASEAQALMDSGRVERLHVVFCDSAVQGMQEFESGDRKSVV